MRSFFILFSLLSFSAMKAQNLDGNFHSPLPVRDVYISEMTKQPDGKILMFGDIDFFGDQPVGHIIRLNSDGSFDNTFSFQYPSDFGPMDMSLHSSGDIVLLLRKYNFKNQTSASRLLRIRSDGTIKFDVAANNSAITIQIQQDGKVLAGGMNTLVRYNENLTDDLAFNSATTVTGFVSDIKAIGDKCFIMGDFSKLNGVTKNDIAKLNQDGSIDDTFDTGTGSPQGIGTIIPLPDGKFLAGNTFVNEFNGISRRGTLRLNADGSVDETFEDFPDLAGPFNTPLHTEEGIYIGSYLRPRAEGYFFRLHHDGSIDETFTPIPMKGAGAMATIQLGEDIMISSARTTECPYGITKVNKSGDVDNSYAPPIGARAKIQFGSRQGDKFIVAGDFVKLDNTPTFGVARLNSDGTVDPTFHVDQDNANVTQIKSLPDGKTLVATGSHFFKLDVNGNIDPSFEAAAGSVTQMAKFIALENKKILAADYHRLVRYDEDGSLDEEFNAPELLYNSGFNYDLQGDNIILGGWFPTIGDEPEKAVMRVSSSGLVDNSFNIGGGPELNGQLYGPFVDMVAVLKNGEILLGGLIPKFDGHSVKHSLVKLSANGAFDEDFNNNQNNATAPPPGAFYKTVVQQIGTKIFIRSPYALYVVNNDGTVDDDFSLPATIDNLWDIIAIDAEEENNSGRSTHESSSLIALGSFKLAGNSTSSSIIKIDLSENITGTEDERNESIPLTVYPQPSTGSITVVAPNELGPFVATVYNTSGTHVLKSILTNAGNAPILDVSNLTPGFYVLKVASNSGKVGYAKFARVP